jgi:ABC-type enterochelin transport system permease subunit
MLPIDRQRLLWALTLAAMALFVASGVAPPARWGRWLRRLSVAAFVLAAVAALVETALWWGGHR